MREEERSGRRRRREGGDAVVIFGDTSRQTFLPSFIVIPSIVYSWKWNQRRAAGGGGRGGGRTGERGRRPVDECLRFSAVSPCRFASSVLREIRRNGRTGINNIAGNLYTACAVNTLNGRPLRRVRRLISRGNKSLPSKRHRDCRGRRKIPGADLSNRKKMHKSRF